MRAYRRVPLEFYMFTLHVHTSPHVHHTSAACTAGTLENGQMSRRPASANAQGAASASVDVDIDTHQGEVFVEVAPLEASEIEYFLEVLGTSVAIGLLLLHLYTSVRRHLSGHRLSRQNSFASLVSLVRTGSSTECELDLSAVPARLEEGASPAASAVERRRAGSAPDATTAERQRGAKKTPRTKASERRRLPPARGKQRSLSRGGAAAGKHRLLAVNEPDDAHLHGPLGSEGDGEQDLSADDERPSTRPSRGSSCLEAVHACVGRAGREERSCKSGRPKAARLVVSLHDLSTDNAPLTRHGDTSTAGDHRDTDHGTSSKVQWRWPLVEMVNYEVEEEPLPAGMSPGVPRVRRKPPPPYKGRRRKLLAAAASTCGCVACDQARYTQVLPGDTTTTGAGSATYAAGGWGRPSSAIFNLQSHVALLHPGAAPPVAEDCDLD